MNRSKKIEGCGHYDSSRGICKLMNQENKRPSLSKETLIEPPGAIESPELWMIPGLICLAQNSVEEVISCSEFIERTKQNDLDDFNW
jgi:hypothetical protein